MVLLYYQKLYLSLQHRLQDGSIPRNFFQHFKVHQGSHFDPRVMRAVVNSYSLSLHHNSSDSKPIALMTTYFIQSSTLKQEKNSRSILNKTLPLSHWSAVAMLNITDPVQLSSVTWPPVPNREAACSCTVHCIKFVWHWWEILKNKKGRGNMSSPKSALDQCYSVNMVW